MINREVNLFGIFALLLLFWKFVNPLNAIFILGNRNAAGNHFHDNPIEQGLGVYSLKHSYRSKVRTAFAASPSIVNSIQIRVEINVRLPSGRMQIFPTR